VNGDAAHLLDLDQRPAARADDRAHDGLGHVHFALHRLLIVGGYLEKGGGGGRGRGGRRGTDRLAGRRRGRGHAQAIRISVGQSRAARVLRQDRVDRQRSASQAQVEQLVGHRAQ